MLLGRSGTTLAFVAAIGLAACASSPPDPPGPEVSACAAGWRTIFSPPARRFPWLRRLAVHGDRLYFTELTDDHAGLFSISTSGDSPTTLLSQMPVGFWIDDQQILFVPFAMQALESMPVAGGAAMSIFSGPPPVDGLASFEHAFALDRDALYWIETDDTGKDARRVWRGARDGSGVTTLLETTQDHLAFPDGVTAVDHDIVVLDDGVLIAEHSAYPDVPWLIPKSAGPPVRLPSFAPASIDAEASIIGAAPDGTMLWSRVDNPEALVKDATFTVGRSNAHGPAPTAFWPGKPRKAEPKAAWPTGAGGWLVAVSEALPDGGKHVVLWAVDAAGEGTRLACDPQVGREIAAAAAGPDALYLGMVYPLGGGVSEGYWELAAVSTATRPDAGP